jgi:hypothetical protein
MMERRPTGGRTLPSSVRGSSLGTSTRVCNLALAILHSCWCCTLQQVTICCLYHIINCYI